MTESAIPELRSVVAATKEYQSFRQHYESTVGTMREHDLTRRHEQGVRQELSDQEATLTDQLRLRLLTKHFSRRGSGPVPQGQQLEQLGQHLVDERLGRPSTRGPFHIRKLLAGVRRIVTGRVATERIAEQIRFVRRELVRSGDRMRDLADASGTDQVNVETAYKGAARSFNNVVTAVTAAYENIGGIADTGRQELNGLHSSLSAARAQIDTGLVTFAARGLASLPPLLRAHHAISAESQREQNELEIDATAVRPRRRGNHPAPQPLGASSRETLKIVPNRGHVRRKSI